MAEAYAQLTGKIGIALLCAGPGFVNGLSAMYSALESQTPILVLAGDAPLNLAGQGAFQDVDQQRGAREFVKGTFNANRSEKMYRLVKEACILAQELDGPVHLSLPVDMLKRKGIASTSATELTKQITAVDDAAVSLSTLPAACASDARTQEDHPSLIESPLTLDGQSHHTDVVNAEHTAYPFRPALDLDFVQARCFDQIAEYGATPSPRPPRLGFAPYISLQPHSDSPRPNDRFDRPKPFRYRHGNVAIVLGLPWLG